MVGEEKEDGMVVDQDCRSRVGGWRGEGACHPLDFDRSVKPQRRSPSWRRGSVGLVTQGSAVRSPVLAT